MWQLCALAEEWSDEIVRRTVEEYADVLPAVEAAVRGGDDGAIEALFLMFMEMDFGAGERGIVAVQHGGG